LERLWRRRVWAQRTSGLSVRAFCERHGLPESAFYFWRRELLRRDAERTAAAVVRRRVEPFADLRDLLARWPTLPRNAAGRPTIEALAALQPHVWQPATTAPTR
jgi:transposase-like protein